MGSRIGVMTAWELLQRAGLARPWPEDLEFEAALDTWTLLLADIPDERLVELTRAWLRSPEVRFGRWPLPGALLHAIPDVESIDDGDAAWADALRLLAWRGRDRAPATVAELENLRSKIRAGIELAREMRDANRVERLLRAMQQLPPDDANRTAALLAGVSACGGWKLLGMADEKEMVSNRSSFRAAYRSHRDRRKLIQTEETIADLPRLLAAQENEDPVPKRIA